MMKGPIHPNQLCIAGAQLPVLSFISASVSHWPTRCPQPSALISSWRDACCSFRTISFRLLSQLAWPWQVCPGYGIHHMAGLGSTLSFNNSISDHPPCTAFTKGISEFSPKLLVLTSLPMLNLKILAFIFRSVIAPEVTLVGYVSFHIFFSYGKPIQCWYSYSY